MWCNLRLQSTHNPLPNSSLTTVPGGPNPTRLRLSGNDVKIGPVAARGADSLESTIPPVDSKEALASARPESAHPCGTAMPQLAVRDLTKRFPTLRVARSVARRVAGLSAGGESGDPRSQRLRQEHVAVYRRHARSPDFRRSAAGRRRSVCARQAETRRFSQPADRVRLSRSSLAPQCSALENVLLPTLAQGGTTTADTEQAGCCSTASG